MRVVLCIARSLSVCSAWAKGVGKRLTSAAMAARRATVALHKIYINFDSVRTASRYIVKDHEEAECCVRVVLCSALSVCKGEGEGKGSRIPLQHSRGCAGASTNLQYI